MRTPPRSQSVLCDKPEGKNLFLLGGSGGVPVCVPVRASPRQSAPLLCQCAVRDLEFR